MVLGIVLGTLAASLIAIIYCFIVDCVDYDDENKIKIIAAILCSLCIVFGGIIGTSVKNSNYEQFIAKYKTTQDIYYSSLKNDKLTGFERVELVKMANDASCDLAEKQVVVKKWYSFDVNNNIKSQISNLKIIK
jgi:hypothetical protein